MTLTNKTASKAGRSKLAKLNKLIKSAEQSAVYRGHVLGQWTITKDFKDQWCASAECSCSAHAYVNTKPLPNEIDIGGQAVAVNHPAHGIRCDQCEALMTLTNKTASKAGRSKFAKARKQLTPTELFFFEHAGYSYDPKTETPEQGRIETAKLLAKAEQHATDNLWEYRWEIENSIPYEEALGDHAYWCEDARNGVEHEHEVYYCLLTDGKDNVLESLGAIIDPSREYRRVVEAELALEAM